MVEVSDLNPISAVGLDKFSIGLGTVGNMLMLVFLIVLIICLVGVAIFLWLRMKKFKFKIPLYARIGNIPTRIAIFKAKEVLMGKAGDRLWYVAKAKKFITPPTIQSAPNEFLHWQRTDGEWVNFAIGDLDRDSKRSGVKYVHQDMRMSRLAIDRLLEQRLMKKGFWEQWGLIISYIVFFLLLTIAMVIIFWQWGGIVERLDGVMKRTETLLEQAIKISGEGESVELVPASILPLLFGFKSITKRKWHSLKIS